MNATFSAEIWTRHDGPTFRADNHYAASAQRIILFSKNTSQMFFSTDNKSVRKVHLNISRTGFADLMWFASQRDLYCALVNRNSHVSTHTLASVRFWWLGFLCSCSLRNHNWVDEVSCRGFGKASYLQRMSASTDLASSIEKRSDFRHPNRGTMGSIGAFYDISTFMFAIRWQNHF